jgi:hypothetical protein
MHSSDIVGHEALDALANHPNKMLGLIRLAFHRGYAERADLRLHLTLLNVAVIYGVWRKQHSK